MKNLRCTGHMKNPQLLEELFQRLPSNFQMHWCMFTAEKPEVDLEDFGKWMKNVAAAASRMPFSLAIDEDPGAIQKSKEKNTSKTAQLSTSERKSPPGCPKCLHSGHQLEDCPEIKELDYEKKWKFATDRWVCFSCLVPGHIGPKCPDQKPCGKDDCKKFHHELLHKPKSDGAATNQNWVGVSIESSSVLLKISPVKIKGPAGSLDTYALIDDGATVSMIDENVARKVGLDGPTCPLHLHWTKDVVQDEDNSKKST